MFVKLSICKLNITKYLRLKLLKDCKENILKLKLKAFKII